MNTLRHPFRIVGFGNGRHDNGEFVAPQSADMAFLADGADQQPAKLEDQLVAHRVAERVVDVFEAVDVEKQQGADRPGCVSIVENGLQKALERAPIMQTGQAVAEGERLHFGLALSEALLHFLALGHIATNGKDRFDETILTEFGKEADFVSVEETVPIREVEFRRGGLPGLEDASDRTHHFHRRRPIGDLTQVPGQCILEPRQVCAFEEFAHGPVHIQLSAVTGHTNQAVWQIVGQRPIGVFTLAQFIDEPAPLGCLPRRAEDGDRLAFIIPQGKLAHVKEARFTVRPLNRMLERHDIVRDQRLAIGDVVDRSAFALIGLAGSLSNKLGARHVVETVEHFVAQNVATVFVLQPDHVGKQLHGRAEDRLGLAPGTQTLRLGAIAGIAGKEYAFDAFCDFTANLDVENGFSQHNFQKLSHRAAAVKDVTHPIEEKLAPRRRHHVESCLVKRLRRGGIVEDERTKGTLSLFKRKRIFGLLPKYENHALKISRCLRQSRYGAHQMPSNLQER